MFDDEIWKDIYFVQNGIEWDYRGLYAVSNYGRVKSFHDGKEKIMKSFITGKGYLNVELSKDGKGRKFKIHRLVAFMFLTDSYFDGAVVNHKDENKENNHVSNLEWCTQEYNVNYGTRNTRQSDAMKVVTGRLIARYNFNRELIDIMYAVDFQKLFNFDQSHIIKVCQWYECKEDINEWHKTHKGNPYKWYKGYIFKYFEN